MEQCIYTSKYSKEDIEKKVTNYFQKVFDAKTVIILNEQIPKNHLFANKLTILLEDIKIYVNCYIKGGYIQDEKTNKSCYSGSAYANVYIENIIERNIA